MEEENLTPNNTRSPQQWGTSSDKGKLHWTSKRNKMLEVLGGDTLVDNL